MYVVQTRKQWLSSTVCSNPWCLVFGSEPKAMPSCSISRNLNRKQYHSNISRTISLCSVVGSEPIAILFQYFMLCFMVLNGAWFWTDSNFISIFHAFISGCLVLGSDPSVYKEFVDAVGDWVTGQCPGGMVYRDDYCMCTLPSIKISSSIIIFLLLIKFKGIHIHVILMWICNPPKFWHVVLDTLKATSVC